MLTIDQIKELLDIIASNNIHFIAKSLGPEYLTSDEIDLLKNSGIDPVSFYSITDDVVTTSFHFGLISDVIGNSTAQKMSFDELKLALKSGAYIPLTQREKFTLESVKKQYLGDIKAHQGRIFSDVNNVISNAEKNNRKAYEKIIRDEIYSGTLKGDTPNQIAREIAHLTGDWSRNFGRIVEFVSHQAFDEGRAALYERMDGEDVKVYKTVYEGACKHCIKLYLTGGIGSEPTIFKLSELRANGTNIGRKVADWLAVVGATHPHCRCTLHKYPEGMKWNPSSGMFDIKIETKKKIQREKIRVVFNNKEYMV